MLKKYFYTTLLSLVFFSLGVSAQEAKQQFAVPEASSSEGLSLYPNPVSNGKVYFITKSDSDKEVAIFDILGKKVLQTVVSSKELNFSLPPGVYIIKIKEDETSTTRKLIVH